MVAMGMPTMVAAQCLACRRRLLLLWNGRLISALFGKSVVIVQYLHATEGCIVAEAQPCCATQSPLELRLTGRRLSAETEHPLVALQD
jgi:hypothetical protein